MDFAPTPQQQILTQSARAFLQQHCPPERVQALALEPGGFAGDLWKAMATLGWPGLLIAADLGGGSGSALDVIALVEEMGRACLPSPFIPSAVVATSMLAAVPASHRVGRLLSALALGDRIATVALLEESGRHDAGAITTRGEAPGQLTGRKLFVKDAHIATDLVVIARGGGGVNALVLPSDRPGITRLPLDVMGDEKLFEVRFDDVEIRSEDLLGAAGLGADLLTPAMRLGALARSAEMVGAAGHILDLCVEHARVRVQSGRPIGAFQAIQHHLADLLRDVEASRWLVYDAAWRVAEGLDEAPAVATAKAFCAEACLRVARRGHQIMGAVGYCEEHPLHLFHKRILAASLDWGDAALHLETVARSIGLA
ncbi:MAG TPA: acyl-CoA dehydrogenase family protein [Candidatus Methylomirabilis sp.]|nr:acyl-CoA dehydrogenase family protein [Candidatus Methylomirabilis sp.]